MSFAVIDLNEALVSPQSVRRSETTYFRSNTESPPCTRNAIRRRKTAELNLDVPCEWPGCTKRYASRTAMMLHVKLKHPTFYSQLDSQRAAGMFSIAQTLHAIT